MQDTEAMNEQPAEPDDSVWFPEEGFPQTRIVSADPCLNLRPSAGILDSPLDCLPMGTVLTVLGHQGVWAEVQLQDGREGWMALSYLVTREQLNDASSVIDTGAGGRITSDEFAMRLSERPEGVGNSNSYMVRRSTLAESSQTQLEAQLQQLQAGLARVQSQTASNSN